MRGDADEPHPEPGGWGRPGQRRSITAPIAAAKMGSEPFSSPVSAELIRCSASGNSVKGIATHRTESATSRGRSARSTGLRAPGTSHSTAAPNSTRSHVTSPGSNASSPIAMNRNEAPQMPPIAANRPQSSGVNAPRWVPRWW